MSLRFFCFLGRARSLGPFEMALCKKNTSLASHFWPLVPHINLIFIVFSPRCREIRLFAIALFVWRWKSAAIWSNWLHKSETRWQIRGTNKKKKNEKQQQIENRSTRLMYGLVGVTACAYVVNRAIQLGFSMLLSVPLSLSYTFISVDVNIHAPHFFDSHSIWRVLIAVAFSQVFVERKTTVQNTIYYTLGVYDRPTDRIRNK